MIRLDCHDEPAKARAAILTAAERGGLATAVQMLSEAVKQMEELAPTLSAEIWTSYAAILAAGENAPLP